MKEQDIKPCPHCGKQAKWENNVFRPFCSERCKLIDLGGWASEKYRIAGENARGEELEEDTEQSDE